MANEISTYLKYANLQMAAESLFGVLPTDVPGAIKGATSMTEATLADGNNRSSKFTPTQAAQFVTEWEVVAHQPDTTTGFSGTLVQAPSAFGRAAESGGQQHCRPRISRPVDPFTRL